MSLPAPYFIVFVGACITLGEYYSPFPSSYLYPPYFNLPPSHPFPPLPSKSLQDSTHSLLHHLTLVPVMILKAVIFLHVQKYKTTYRSHYFLAMSLNRRQRRCPQCTFWFSSLSRHYQYSPRCNLTRSSSKSCREQR